jgi:hypothetical protein
MISIYSSAFNLIKNNFNYKYSVKNFCAMADEVVICVNTSEDETLSVLTSEQRLYNNLKIISSDIPYSDYLLDGKIKNLALQSTSSTHQIKIGLDMDEYIPIWQKPIWYAAASNLIYDNSQSYMIPSINLYKTYEYYSSITPKWYMHKSGLFRGPVNFAIKNNGFIDTTKSDTCELIDSNGNLVLCKAFPSDIQSLRGNNLPFVVHTGYLSLENRLLRNKNFWLKHWLLESGGEPPIHKVHESMDDFQEQFQEHRLKI